MTINRLKDKRVAVLGLGIEGMALTNFLVDQVGSIGVFDKKNKGELFENQNDNEDQLKNIIDNPKIIKNFGQNLENVDLQDYDVIFRSPSIYFDSELIRKNISQGKEISSQIKLFFELCPCKIIGVTGTKGKGTTASLIYEILKSRKMETSNVYLAGNIGYPVISLIPDLKKDDLIVLELSNFQLADLDKSPHIAVVTNLGTDHLDYHKTREEYLQAKYNILKYQSENDYCILNINSTFDDLTHVESKKLFFGQEYNHEADAIVRSVNGQLETAIRVKNKYEKVCSENEISLVGKHNFENIAAAALTVDIFGVGVETISKVVKEFRGLPYRLQLVRNIKGVRFINDSFATNPGPTIAAVNAFKEDKVLIMGGSSKNSDFSELADRISGSNVRAIVLIGQEADKIKQSLLEASFRGKIFKSIDLKGAVKEAYNITEKDDVVIFSPACASFDMFKNYKVRGEQFDITVRELVNDQ